VKITKVNHKGKLSLKDAVEFQVKFHCFINKIEITDMDAKCLTLLILNENPLITDFCEAASGGSSGLPFKTVLFKNSQTVRNSLRRLEKKSLIAKEGEPRKKRVKATFMDLESRNILIEIKLVSING
jgi:hypothetical protein